MSQIILDRSWYQFVEPSGNPGETYNFIRLATRISLLAMAFEGRAKYSAFGRDVANIYLLYCLLERRIAGLENPVEGIRLVKFS